jgi:hypothetical protein
MRKATSVDWRNKPRAVANNEAEKRAELHAALEKFIRTSGGWLTSSPSTKPVRFETLPGSSLPTKLSELGWSVRYMGVSTRILPAAVTETFYSPSERRTVERAFTGLAEVHCYEAKA